MSQISMPMRILLVGAVVFLAAWFTILKPGAGTEELPPATPANAAPVTAAPAAQAPATNVANAEPATAIPADVLATLPKTAATALKERKVLVLGVFADDAKAWRPMADDDRYVRNALAKTNRYDGEVVATTTGLDGLSRYAPLVNDLGVRQSPAVVVIDRDLKGTVLTGYVDRVAINQAIADARRASVHPYITDSYLRAANQICRRFALHESRFSYQTVRGEQPTLAMVARGEKLDRQWIAAIERVAAPDRWKGLKAHWLRVLRADLAAIQGMREGFEAKDVKAVKAAARSLDVEDNRALDRRFDDAGVTSCVINRRS